MAKQDRKKVLPKLREMARQKYLVDRKDIKLDELRADIADDEYLFSGASVTEVDGPPAPTRTPSAVIREPHSAPHAAAL